MAPPADHSAAVAEVECIAIAAVTSGPEYESPPTRPSSEGTVRATAIDRELDPLPVEPVLIANVAYQTPIGKWSSGLFDCCQDKPICCYVTFCYWCAFGNIMSAHLDKPCRDECCSVALWDVCNGCFGPYYHSLNRGKIRKKYGDIPEEKPCDVR